VSVGALGGPEGPPRERWGPHKSSRGPHRAPHSRPRRASGAPRYALGPPRRSTTLTSARSPLSATTWCQFYNYLLVKLVQSIHVLCLFDHNFFCTFERVHQLFRFKAVKSHSKDTYCSWPATTSCSLHWRGFPGTFSHNNRAGK
jgi:hypothetical protein